MPYMNEVYFYMYADLKFNLETELNLRFTITNAAVIFARTAACNRFSSVEILSEISRFCDFFSF